VPPSVPDCLAFLKHPGQQKIHGFPWPEDRVGG
jgi:hypothetical protein